MKLRILSFLVKKEGRGAAG